MRAARDGWVKVGTDTTVVLVMVGLGLAVLGGVLLAVPISRLVEVTSGTLPGWWPTALWTFIVLAVLLCVPLAIFANRPATINSGAGLLRVAWRTVPFGALRHVYRMPGGTNPSQFVIQLEIEGGLDARLPISSAALPNLTADELRVLLDMLERSPIEPNPRFPARAPIAGELGPRSAELQIADHVSEALQPFGRVSYAKATLLLEVRDAIARQERTAGGAEAVGDALPSERLRATTTVVRALREAPRHTMAIMPDALEAPEAAPTQRFSVRRRTVEEWLSTVGAHVRTYTLSRVVGWVVIGLSLVIPWVLTFAVMRGWAVYVSAPFDTLMGWWGASILTWPFGVWFGVVLLKRARALRNRSARREAVNSLVRGHRVPEFVAPFFGSTKAERSYGVHVYVWLLVLSIAFAASGLVFLALSGDMVGGPYSPLVWHAPLGWVLLMPVIPVFVGALRWQRYMYGQLARAQVEWRLLGNSSV